MCDPCAIDFLLHTLAKKNERERTLSVCSKVQLSEAKVQQCVVGEVTTCTKQLRPTCFCRMLA